MVAVRGCQKGPQTILKITLKEGIVEFISYRYCYCWSLVQMKVAQETETEN